MEQNFDHQAQFPSLPTASEELKQIRRNLRRRNWKLILTSVALAAILIVSFVQLILPLWENRYWDPTVSTYLEDVPDLELTMATYNELFGHGQHLMSLQIQKNGFASYEIQANFLEWETIKRLTSFSQRSASLVKGALITPENFWIDIVEGSFPRERDPEALHIQLTNESTMKILAELPEYIQVLASITFPEDLTMRQLQSFTESYDYEEARFLWAILRSCDPEASNIPACGVLLSDHMTERYDHDFWDSTDYPNLFPEYRISSCRSAEAHITSMLRFSAHQVQNGTGILPPGAEADYYETVLNYMEENGIRSYGCYVLATPQVLLQIAEENKADYIYLIDARIGL